MTGKNSIAGVPESGPPASLLDTPELLAEDIMCLLVALKRKLRRYLAAQAMASTDESSLRDNDCAVKWMEDTMGDMMATVLGMELGSAEAGDNQAKH